MEEKCMEGEKVPNNTKPLGKLIRIKCGNAGRQNSRKKNEAQSRMIQIRKNPKSEIQLGKMRYHRIQSSAFGWF